MVELFIIMVTIFKDNLNKIQQMDKEYYVNLIKHIKVHLKIIYNMEKDNKKVNYFNLKVTFIKDLKYLVN